MATTIALDVRGVLLPCPTTSKNRATVSPSSSHQSYAGLSDETLRSVVSSEAMTMFHQLHTRSDITMTWHDSQHDPVVEEVNCTLNPRQWPIFATEAEQQGRADRWWKLSAVERWLRQARTTDTLIWIDDEIAEVSDLGNRSLPITADSRLITVSPDTRVGLTPADLDFILNAAG